ncbi:TetR/AcrR family transcriptional regulator [Alkanindiges sp. WGS2144]|uniref:TetR/AcrR family transcriptional regulator n=1 Tax=Alkanindiges sp. WGS2144 TaxID=3366808 RepID=UPI003753DF34
MSNLKDKVQPGIAKRVYGKKSAEDRVLERYERLMEAGLQLFATQGYANTTIEALCSEARVTTRNFYQAFSGREALLLAVYNRMIEEFQTGLLAVMQAEHHSMQESLRQAVQALVTHYLTDTRRARIGVLEVVGASPVIEHRRREVIHGIAMNIQLFLDMLARQQQIPKQNYHWLAIAIVGGINEMMAEWLMNQSLSLEQLIDEMMQMLEILLQGIHVVHST